MTSGWNWFDPSTADRTPKIASTFEACFATAAGKAVLEYLRQSYLERRLGPDCTDAQLRHLEGARMAIAHIERMAGGMTGRQTIEEIE